MLGVDDDELVDSAADGSEGGGRIQSGTQGECVRATVADGYGLKHDHPCPPERNEHARNAVTLGRRRDGQPPGIDVRRGDCGSCADTIPLHLKRAGSSTATAERDRL